MKLAMCLGVLGAMATVAACGSGSAGPQGPQGPAGPQGAQGPAGAAPDGGANLTPSVSGIEPPNAFLARTAHVTISGFATNWSSSTTVDFGTGVTVANLHAASPTALVADITIAKTATLGARDVVVHDGANTETYSQAFTLAAPATVTMQGSLAQGAILLANVELQDMSTPFDTTSESDIFGDVTYTNLNLNAPTGITAEVETATSTSVQLLLTVDVTTPTTSADFDLLSGPAGDASDVDFPVPGGLTVTARTATALGSAASSGNLTTAYDSALYSYTPASAALSIVDLTANSTVSGANAGFALLPKSGAFADLIGFFQAANGSGTSATTTILPAATDPYYAIYWDNSGTTGAYTMGATATAPADTKAAATGDDTTAAAIVATALPFVLTGGDLSHGANGDWVKVTMPAGSTSLRVQTAGDVNTDAAVGVTTDGSTAAGTTSDQTETGSFVDATFTGLTSGTTYYVVFEPGTLGGTTTDYEGVIRAE